MSSPPVDALTAQERFQRAFERLKAGQPKVLPRGTPVTQNNVAREAGCDPSALKKRRFPALVSQIQAFLELRQAADLGATAKVSRKKATKRSTKERLDDAIQQRDMAQSVLASANLRVVELTEEVRVLRQRLEVYEPPPVKLGRR